MARVKTPRDVKGPNDLKILQKTTTSVLQSRIPLRSAVNLKHCHTLKASRDIVRIDRQPWEERVAGILRLAENHRYNRANALHHTLQQVQILLRDGAIREKRLKSTSDELKQTSNYLQAIMDSMVDILIATDFEGIISETNLAAERLSGYTREELMGNSLYALFTEPDIAREGIGNVLVQKSIADGELTLLRKDGRPVPVLYNGTVLSDAEDQVSGILVSARDITELKKAQEAREMFAKELARANADLEEFASVASHDLEEPLKKLMSYAENLRVRYKGALDSEAQKDLGDMVEQAGFMQELIKSVLSYAKVDTGVSVFDQTDCEEVLSQALRSLSGAIEESGALISHDPLPVVRANKAQLVRVFQNIIGNAIKYRNMASREKTHIHVAAQRIETTTIILPDNAGKKGWLFSIQDNGIGIDQEFIDEIFDMFVRLHPESEYHGAGMGLSIARKIMRRHHGAIWAESSVGKGSTFFFSLPEVSV